MSSSRMLGVPFPAMSCSFRRSSMSENLNRSAYTCGPALPIDITPLERQVLARAHASGQSQLEQREPLRLLRHLQEPPAFFDAESLHFFRLDARQIDASGRIFGEH